MTLHYLAMVLKHPLIGSLLRYFIYQELVVNAGTMLSRAYCVKRVAIEMSMEKLH